MPIIFDKEIARKVKELNRLVREREEIKRRKAEGGRRKADRGGPVEGNCGSECAAEAEKE